MNVNNLSIAARRFLIKLAKRGGVMHPSGSEHAAARALAKAHYITDEGKHGGGPYELAELGFLAIRLEVNRFDRRHKQAKDQATSILYNHKHAREPRKGAGWEPAFDKLDHDLVERITRAILDAQYADLREVFDDRFPAACNELRAALEDV